MWLRKCKHPTTPTSDHWAIFNNHPILSYIVRFDDDVDFETSLGRRSDALWFNDFPPFHSRHQRERMLLSRSRRSQLEITFSIMKVILETEKSFSCQHQPKPAYPASHRDDPGSSVTSCKHLHSSTTCRFTSSVHSPRSDSCYSIFMEIPQTSFQLSVILLFS